MLSEADDTSSIQYAYSDAGQIVQITQSSDLAPTVVFAYACNDAGLCSSVAVSIDGVADYVDDYSYDSDENLVAISRHGVDGGHAVAQIDVTLSYTDSGQLASISRYLDGALTVTADYTYDSADLLVGLVYHQGDTVLAYYTFSHIAWDTTASVGPTAPTGQSMLPVSDTSDITSALASGTYVGTLLTSVESTDGTATYTYDALGQLLSATYSNDSFADESYTYDANGNRLTANGNTYTTGADNQLLSDGTYTYVYDAEGNRIARFIDTNDDGLLNTGDTDVTEYTWDARNRLIQVTDRATAGGHVTQVVDYLYDTENRWIGETIDSDGDGDIDRTIGFVYDGDQIVLQFEKDSSGQLSGEDLSHRYLWQANAVDQLMADEQLSSLASEGDQSEGNDLSVPGNVVWTLGDHLGTIRDLAVYDSETGLTTVSNHRVYDSFGNLKSQANAAVDCLFGFTGRAYDEATGLQNNLNRWYDGDMGQWISKDRIGFTASDANLYRYVGNSPTDSIDPTGMNRWVMTNGGHWWLVVEEWDATGTTVIGYHKLEYWVYGYEIDWGSRPKNPRVGDFIDKGGKVVGEWKSNAAQDNALLDEWRKLAADENRRHPGVYYLGYYIGRNCESIALLWADYGGAAGPATLIIKYPSVPRNTMGPDGMTYGGALWHARP